MLLKRTVHLAFLCMSLFVQAQAQPEVKSKTYDAYEFEGFVVPGTTADAKRTGFTNCAFKNYSGYVCSREVPGTVYGIALGSASVTLNGDANFSIGGGHTDWDKLGEVPVEKLTYGSIVLRPAGKDSNAFLEALQQAGWIELFRSGTVYYKRGANAKLTTDRNGITIHPVTTKEVDDNLDQFEQKNREREQIEDSERKIKDFMKS